MLAHRSTTEILADAGKSHYSAFPESQQPTATANTTVLQKTSPSYTSQWKTTRPVPMTPESFMDLLEGRTPLLKQANFLPDTVCARLEKELEPDLSPYLHAIGPAVNKVGVAQFEYQAQSAEDFVTRKGDEKERYFSMVQKIRHLHTSLAEKIGTNVFETVLDQIKSLAPEDWEVCLACEREDSSSDSSSSNDNNTPKPKKEYFAGVIRGINQGLPIHCDWAPYDTLTEEWIISHVTHQAVFNLYLTPVKGGGTTVHDVQWTPEVLKFRDPAGYGYFEQLTKHKLEAPFQPQLGDLYIFNSRNMHHVDPVDPDHRRVRMTMASFFGVLPPQTVGDKTKLIFWS